MDNHTFYYEASRRICSSLKIEKALHESLLYLQTVFPVDWLTLHLFDPGLGFVETVASAGPNGAELSSKRTLLTAEIRELIQVYIEFLAGDPKIQILERFCDDEMAMMVAEDFEVTDAPGMILDLLMDGDYLGILTVSNTCGHKYSQEDADRILLLHDPFALACANFRKARELAELNTRLVDNYRSLQDDMIQLKGDEVVGVEHGLAKVMKSVRQVAPTSSPVLLLGETGVGKEVIAQTIHRLSPRRNSPLITVDCASIPESLVESELFGHEKGAFTGALSRSRGRFERAQGGTVFLDEIGELSTETQKKILRVLQTGTIERVGGAESIELDIRIIAATHRPLETMITEGKFRQDLFFRLNVFPINIPPLRERREDIPLLVNYFVTKQSRKMGLPNISSLAPGAIDILTAHPWPGNVRELRNIVERELIISGDKPLTFSSLATRECVKEEPTAESMEIGELSLDLAVAAHIQKVLDLTEGRVEGQKGAARLLDVHPRTLQHRMKKMGIVFGRNYKKANGS